MKKFLATIILVSAVVFAIRAQNIGLENMLMFSQNYSLGTARTTGMGGAFGALGADQTAIGINPAGIGVYRSSDFSFSLSLNDNISNSNYLNNTAGDFSDKLKIANIGYVYNHHVSDKDKGIVSWSFGITYNRLNDFDKNVIIRNPNTTSSLLDEFNYYANNSGAGALSPNYLSNSYEGAAWLTYLLDTTLYGPGMYNTPFSSNHIYGQSLVKTVRSRGGIGDWDFTFGLNAGNKLFFGVALGILNVDYQETDVHTETDVTRNNPLLNSFSFSQFLRVTGTGYNFKAGIIYRPIDLLRIGLAVHSPTMYKLTSDFHTETDVLFDVLPVGASTTNPFYSDTGTIDINRFHTPWKFIGSLGFHLGKFGLLSMDYERLDYGSMKITDDESFGQTDSVKANYKSVNNFRFGAEGKLGRFAIRAGLGLNGSPIKGITGITYKTYSVGAGYTGKSFYCDIAYSLLQYNSKHFLYQFVESQGLNGPVWANSPQIAEVKNYSNRFVATIGFRF